MTPEEECRELEQRLTVEHARLRRLEEWAKEAHAVLLDRADEFHGEYHTGAIAECSYSGCVAARKVLDSIPEGLKE